MANLKSINTLIKVAKQKLDGLRRDLARLESEKQKMQDAIAKAKEELLREMKLAAENPEMGAFFGDYSKRIKNREDELKASIAKLDELANKLRDSIRDQFAEQKKYELAKEARVKEAQAEEDKREVKVSDEIAAMQFDRRKRKKKQ